MATEYLSTSELETAQIAAAMAEQWKAGDLIVLVGPLGAGKTTFVRAVLRALGWNGPVRSPTYNLMQTFPTAPPVAHIDLYRISESEDLGIDELLPDHLTFVEWPGKRFDAYNRWLVQFEIVGTCRRISITKL